VLHIGAGTSTLHTPEMEPWGRARRNAEVTSGITSAARQVIDLALLGGIKSPELQTSLVITDADYGGFEGARRGPNLE
jgi:hypothetical protein